LINLLKNNKRIIISLIILYFISLPFLKGYYIAINISPSLPDYFYFYKKKFTTKDLDYNKVIAFLFKHKNDRYYKYNYQFIKKIACKEGDLLEVKNKQYFCNGVFLISALSKDSKGRKIDNFKFNGIIPENKYFVLGTHLKSYDSRYWGFVDRKDIIGVAIW